MLVVRFDHLDIERLVERGGDLFGELHQQVHAKAHVAGADDRGVAGGGVKLGDILARQAGGADHVHGAGLGGERGQRHGGGRRGEVDHRLGLRHRVKRVVGDGHAKRGPAHRLADIAADPVVPRSFQRTHQPGRRAFVHQLHQHPAHPARCPVDDDPR